MSKTLESTRRPFTLLSVIPIVAVLFFIAVAAPSAEAATFSKRTVTYVAGGDLPVPIALPPDDYVGGFYHSCAAEPRWGEYCVDKVTPYDRNGNPMRPTCAYVTFEAHCGCNPKTLELKGSCKFYYH